VVDVNAAACELLGGRREALVERPLADVVPALGPGGSDRWELRRAVGRASGEIEVSSAGGGRRVAEYAAVAGIRPGRDLVVLRDVTEHKHVGARLALADRMASVGTLAAGVAHELNNPLAYVSANLSFLSDRVVRAGELLAGRRPEPEDADLAAQLGDAVRDARDGCDRMRMIVRDLKTFSRPDDDHTGPVDLGRVIDAAVNMAWNGIKHRAKLVKDVAGLPPVHGNESRLGQVFLNLLMNAAQSLPEGHADGNHIRVSGAVLPDGRVLVEVKDTGCGIPAEHLARIFDPFFTTKPPGVGTGLGLSICHSIVGAFGGEIQVQSEPGKGSTFRVVLRPAGAARARPAGEVAGAPAARARILVVDDEAMVGSVLARTLRTEHDVQVVTSARAALDLLASGERYDLVLSDLLMPEMTGMDLHEAIEARDADLAQRMVFLTGGAFTPAAREFLVRKQVVCIEKPFEVTALRATLARKLAERPALAR
jgi:signal transduction histidine kinase/ActR/RegA family two-component response regulator